MTATLGDVAEAAEVEKTVAWRVVAGYRATKGDTTERAVWVAVTETGWLPRQGSQAERYMAATGRLGPVAAVGGATYYRHPGRGWCSASHHQPVAEPTVVARLDQTAALTNQLTETTP